MTEEVKKIRNDIIKKFCRTILWIDDEINLDKGLAAGGTNPLFKNKYDEFTKSSLLCHMMGFPATINDSDPYAHQPQVDEILRSCVSLALQSDIVIVDWMLGTTDSSEYAQKIVKEIVGKDKGFRFIVILSQKEPADSEFTGIDSSFACEASDDLWQNGSGQFLLSLRKDVFNDKNLFERICNALLKVYSDYLHLAALEIAGRIKDRVPQWLSNIPTGADIGILVERGFAFERNTWNAELQEGISENLLEDLSLTIQQQDLDTINPEMLKPMNNELCEALLDNQIPDSEIQNAFGALKQCVDTTNPKAIKLKHYQALLAKRDNNTINTFVKGIETFAEFCDRHSFRDGVCQRVCPGCICEGLTDKSNLIAVCITAACDCMWGDSLLFLIGAPMPHDDSNGMAVPDYQKLHGIMKSKRTVLRFNGVPYIFMNTADSILVKKKSDVHLSNIKGVVRRDVLNRLIGRYMSHTQRFGVNQPNIVRELRNE